MFIFLSTFVLNSLLMLAVDIRVLLPFLGRPLNIRKACSRYGVFNNKYPIHPPVSIPNDRWMSRINSINYNTLVLFHLILLDYSSVSFRIFTCRTCADCFPGADTSARNSSSARICVAWSHTVLSGWLSASPATRTTRGRHLSEGALVYYAGTQGRYHGCLRKSCLLDVTVYYVVRHSCSQRSLVEWRGERV